MHPICLFLDVPQLSSLLRFPYYLRFKSNWFEPLPIPHMIGSSVRLWCRAFLLIVSGPVSVDSQNSLHIFTSASSVPFSRPHCSSQHHLAPLTPFKGSHSRLCLKELYPQFGVTEKNSTTQHYSKHFEWECYIAQFFSVYLLRL